MVRVRDRGRGRGDSVTRWHRGRVAALSALIVTAVACGGTSAATPPANSSLALAHLMTVNELAAGQLDALPTGTQFVRVVMFNQAPNQTIASKKHQAGIVYVDSGLQRLTYTGGASVDIAAGTALFLKSVEHSHTTLPPTISVWYFIALWPSVQRPTPLNGSTAAFDSEDIAANTLSPGTYVETLRKVTLQPGGRSPAHRFGGLEVVFVLDGALTVKVAGQAPVVLSPGNSAGDYIAPGSATQEIAAGSSKVDYLAFFVTEAGKPFETALTSVP
jgi:quercetin dioxygenase-like cupin family protein